jgi:hypothetical protein
MVRVYQCEICGHYSPDVMKRRVYKPSVTSCLKTVALCNKCGRNLYENKGWLVMRAI